MPEQPQDGLTAAIIAGILATALVGIIVTWIARCGGVFHTLTRTTDQKLVERQAAQESKLGDALELILRASLPQLFDTFFERYAPPPVLSPAQLRLAATEMETDESLSHVRARSLVTQPVVRALLPQIDDALQALADDIGLSPPVDAAILRLRCYAGAVYGIEQRATRLAWRFGLQAIALFIVLAYALGAALGRVSVEGVTVAGVVVVAHGLWSELQLRMLDRDLAVLPSILDTGAG